MQKETTKKNNLIFNIASVVFVLIIFYFLGHKFYILLPQIREIKFDLRYSYLISAIFLDVISLMFLAYLWREVLKYLHLKTEFSRVFLSYISSIFGKYVPGKIWGVIIRLRVKPKYDFSNTDIILSSFLENAFLVAAGFIIGLISIFKYFSNNHFWIFGCGTVFLLTLVCLHPKIFYLFLNFILEKFKKPVFTKDKQVSYLALLSLLIQYLIFWLLAGTIFFLAFNAFYPIPAVHIIDIASIMGLGYSVSYFVVLAPAGLGIREGIWFIFLSKFLPAEAAISLSLVFRIFGIFGEVIGLIFAILLRKFLTMSSNNKQTNQL